MAFSETNTPIKENPDSTIDTQRAEIDPTIPVVEVTAQDPENSDGVVRKFVGRLAGRIITPHEVLLEDAEVFKAAGSESLALKSPGKPSPQPQRPKGFDLDYAKDLNSIDDLINIDDRGVARHAKKTSTSKGDGRFLSRDEVGLIAEHQDQIRNDLQQAPDPTPPSTVETPPTQPGETSRTPPGGTPQMVGRPTWKPPLPGTTDYDPTVLDMHREKHMTRRSVVGFGPNPTPEAPPVILSQSTIAGGERTELQHQAEVRANVRIDEVYRREHKIARYVELYGEIILPGSHELAIPTGEVRTVKINGKDEAVPIFERSIVFNADDDIPEGATLRDLGDILREGRFTAAQKRSIRKAARKVRRALGSKSKYKKRLQASSEGTDIPGTLVAGRIAASEAKGRDKHPDEDDSEEDPEVTN